MAFFIGACCVETNGLFLVGVCLSQSHDDWEAGYVHNDDVEDLESGSQEADGNGVEPARAETEGCEEADYCSWTRWNIHDVGDAEVEDFEKYPRN